MKLDLDFYRKVAEIQWLSKAGSVERSDFCIPCIWIESRRDALESIFSTSWADALTVAQGALTGYLSENHNKDYGGVWNDLAKRSRMLIEKSVSDRLTDSLTKDEWRIALNSVELPAMNRAVSASIGAQMTDFLERGDRVGAIRWQIMTNINRAALEICYRSKYSNTPVFFERLFSIYSTGRLPCGWVGDLDQWPNGSLIVC